MVQGGAALLTNTWTNRASATSESVPVVSVSGGTAYVTLVMGMGGTGPASRGWCAPSARWSRRVGLGSLTQPA